MYMYVLTYELASLEKQVGPSISLLLMYTLRDKGTASALFNVIVTCTLKELHFGHSHGQASKQ